MQSNFFCLFFVILAWAKVEASLPQTPFQNAATHGQWEVGSSFKIEKDVVFVLKWKQIRVPFCSNIQFLKSCLCMMSNKKKVVTRNDSARLFDLIPLESFSGLDLPTNADILKRYFHIRDNSQNQKRSSRSIAEVIYN